jgi:hypothetical protein
MNEEANAQIQEIAVIACDGCDRNWDMSHGGEWPSPCHKCTINAALAALAKAIREGGNPDAKQKE